MPKLKSYKIFPSERDFLAIPDHYINVTAKIPYASLTGLTSTNAPVYGTEAVVQRGTLVNVDANGLVTKPTTGVVPNAVIFDTIRPSDFDETDAFVNASVLIHGVIRKDRVTELTVGDLGKLANGMISVMV